MFQAIGHQSYLLLKPLVDRRCVAFEMFDNDVKHYVFTFDNKYTPNIAKITSGDQTAKTGDR